MCSARALNSLLQFSQPRHWSSGLDMAFDDGESPSPCCLSHLFYKSASKCPGKVAVIHATGFARLIRKRSSDGRVFDETTTPSSSGPLVYDGDECFTYSDVLYAVENLSSRLRRILGGEDDPELIKAETANISSLRAVHDPGLLQCQSSIARSGDSVQKTCMPKVVGIYMEPSVEYIVAVMSVLRCGEAFLPLDPSWPKERILSLIFSSRADLVIGMKSSSKENFCHRIDSMQWLIQDGRCPVLLVSLHDNTKGQTPPLPVKWPCEIAISRSFSYLMYTSGSSGTPKGVCGTELGLLNRFLWMQELFPPYEGDILIFKTAISFIDHLQEFLGAILTNCTLVIPPFNELKENIFYVTDFLQGYSVARLIAVPSLTRTIFPALQGPTLANIRDSLKLLVLSGEVLHISLCKMLVEFLPRTVILNLYGSTEVTGDCLYFNCKRLPLILENEALSSVPIGLPISNCDVVLVGEHSPNHGEIYVGGKCVAAGYFDYPYLMPLADTELPRSHDAGLLHNRSAQCYFKTGDFARKLPSGDFVFLGRKDRTVKLNGHRMALEEIESAFRDHPAVVDAAVLCREFEEEILFLEAHLVTKKLEENDDLLKSSLRSWIKSKLPQMMTPSRILLTGSLPLTSSGKINYLSLAASAPSEKGGHINIEEIPQDQQIQIIKKVFCDALMAEQISVDGDFFDMGGSSISAAYAAFRLGINMKLLYAFPTPKKLHAALSSSLRLARFGESTQKPEVGNLISENTRSLMLHKRKLPETYLDESRLNSTDVYYPVKQLKVESSGNACLKEKRPEDLSILTAMHVECSFSRYNQSTHGRQCKGNFLCGRVWSNTVPRDGKGSMQELWRVGLRACVDASPLVVFKGNEIYLFIGSHFHNFACIDAKSGVICWEINLEGRVECSAAILEDFSQVVVGCYQGNIYFLQFSNGSVCHRFPTNGEVKAQPVVDRCRHLVWCGSYDQNLYAIDYKSYCCIYKLPCSGSIFSSPAIDEIQGNLYVASTSGHVVALSIKAMPYKKLWKLDMQAPIFASVLFDNCNANVICCLVDGSVVALTTCGSIAWKARTGGPIFAGPCASTALPSQVLVCSRDGSIYSFEMKNGNLLWKHAIGHPITSAAYVDENALLKTNTPSSSYRLICVCDTSGSVRVLRVDSNAIECLAQDRRRALKIGSNAIENSNLNSGNVVHEFARLDLEGDVFSSPVMIGGRVFVGCRDDNVYCIKLVVE